MRPDKLKDLIIAPHADDEVLGCGGILGKDSFVYYCGINESLVAPDKEHRIGQTARLNEIKSVSDFLGFGWKCNMNTQVNHYKETEFIQELETLINEIRPDRVFIPFPSFNQDHRAVYNAALVSLRPHDKNFFVKKVLVYEQCHAITWEDKNFKVNYFIPIDIERKIKAYQLHKSQVRPMRSSELVKAIARVRGGHINCEYAEAYLILRWVD